MKLVINKDVMINGLQKMQATVGSRTTLPILYNVLLVADKEGVTLSATDLEVSVQTRVEAKITRTGGTTLPARRLFSIVRELPAHEIELDVDDKDVATLRAGSATFKIIGISQDEFPPMPKFQGGKHMELQQSTLRRMLSCTHFAASTDESRYILNGVLFSFRGGKLTVVATDGRRMAHFEQELNVPKESEGDFVVPSKAINELLKALAADGESTVKLHVTENQAAFEVETLLIVTKLLEGTYPNFKQVIPSRCEERITMERESLMAAIRRISILVSEKSNSVTLGFGKNKVVISASSPEVGEAQESIPVKYTGKEISVSFNPEFILDPLKNLSEDEVSLELSDELSPGVMKTNLPFLYVLMPMRVK